MKEWSGSLCPIDPANFWIDDVTGERVNALTNERSVINNVEVNNECQAEAMDLQV